MSGSSPSSGSDVGPLVPVPVPSSLPVQFQQQGTVDWVDLSKHTFNFSLDLLSRISSNQVQPFTFGVGQAISANSELSPAGWRNVNAAIGDLKSVPSFGNVMWFGFGIRSLPRVAAATREGTVCMALCAALAEGYNAETAAEIFAEMLKLNRSPQTFSPSAAEWRGLVQAFEGTFAQCSFPLVLQQFVKFGKDAPLSTPITRSKDLMYRYTDLKAIAETLWALGRVSRRDLAAIDIHGQCDLAWLAAVSDWLLGLPILVQREDGVTVFSNCQPGEERVRFIYQASSDQCAHSLQNVKTFRLDSALRLISWDDLLTKSLPCMMGGKLAWNMCLSSAFGSTFQTLVQSISTLGTIIGSAARISTACYLGLKANTSSKSAKFHWMLTYCSRSPHGFQIIQSILKILSRAIRRPNFDGACDECIFD